MNRFAGIYFQIPQVWLKQPAADATTEDRTPDLIVEYGGFLSGTITFEIDKVSTFNSPNKQTGSAIGLTDGDSGTWTPTSLSNGDWYWRAKATNEAGDSDWTSARKLTVQAGVSIRTFYQYENVSKYGPDWTKKRVLYQIENVAKWGPDWTKKRALYQYENITDDPPFPYIAYLSTTKAGQGSSVTIYGNGFGAKAESDPENPDRAARGYGGYVYLNDQICGIISWAWQQITFTVPNDAVSGPVKVRLTTPDPPGVRDSNVIGLEVYDAVPTPNIGLEFYVCHRNNPNLAIALLDAAQNKSFQALMNGMGSGKFRISRRDPKGDRTLISNENYISCKINGIEYFKWIIENKAPVYVAEGDASEEWIECSGRGVLCILERAMVYPESMPLPGNLERSWTEAHAAAIFKTLIEEAQARGALPEIEIDFTATHDSIGNPWDDLTDISFHAGTPLLDVATKFSESMGIFDLEMTPALKLKAYKDKGVDRSWKIRYHAAQGLLDYSDQSTTDRIKNVVLVEGEAGSVVEVAHPDSPGIWGRREGYLQARNIPNDVTQLQNYGNSMLATTAAAQWSIQTRVDWWPFKPFEDYQLGDWVWATISPAGSDTLGIDQRMRVKGFTVEEDETGHLTCTVDLNHIRTERQLKILKLLERLAMYSDIESGLSSPSEKPPAPLAHNHDHGTLTGLGDDDHPQYYNEARHTADPHISVPRVSSLKKTGATPLTGDVTLEAGANVTLTQDDEQKKITIAASGGGGGGPQLNTAYSDDFSADINYLFWREEGNCFVDIVSGILNIYGMFTNAWDKQFICGHRWERSNKAWAAVFKVNAATVSSDQWMLGWRRGGLYWGNSHYHMHYGVFMNNGTLGIYEDGTNRNSNVGSYTANTDIWFRLNLKQAGGCLYERSDNGTNWSTIYNSNYGTVDRLGIGFAPYNNTAILKVKSVSVD